MLVFDDFRLPLNFCAYCVLLTVVDDAVVAAAAAAAAIAFNDAAIDALFNCFDKLDEWCSVDDVVRFLTSADASSLDGVSPVISKKRKEQNKMNN